MKDKFKYEICSSPPSQFHPNTVWQPSGWLESEGCSCFAKTPVVAQLSLSWKQRTFNAAYFHSDFMAKQILRYVILMACYTHFWRGLYIATQVKCVMRLDHLNQFEMCPTALVLRTFGLFQSFHQYSWLLTTILPSWRKQTEKSPHWSLTSCF